MFRRNDQPAGTTYQMRQEIFAIGDDFWVENSAGARVFKVDGKALRVRKTLVLENAVGSELYKIQEKMLHIRDTMEIETDAGSVASVKKKLISPLREHYDVHLAAGGELDVQGNIVDHEYEMQRDGDRIARVSKKFFRVRDTYGIEVEPNQDDAFIIAIAIVVDAMAHPHR